jgi:uncharacterized protein
MMLITPSKLSLFSRSPVIGAWWEELEARGLFEGDKPEVSALDQQLFTDGLRHEQVLLAKLEVQGHRVARLPGKQTEADYAATKAAMTDYRERFHDLGDQHHQRGGRSGLPHGCRAAHCQRRP